MDGEKSLIAGGTAQRLNARGIDEETCAKWGYLVGEFKGKPVQIANYRDTAGNLVAQKVRFADKSFTVRGDLKKAGLYGQHLWRDGGRRVVVTEGEIDALSVSQVQGNKWPVVSIPNGAQSARKALASQIEWLSSFEEVVLMFDNDEPGRQAVEECYSLFKAGKCKVAKLPLKDANEMLKAGRADELRSAIFEAKVMRPDGIVTLSDVRDRVLMEPEEGYPWFVKSMNELTFGRRLGEAIALGAGTGIGKTDFITQQVDYDINVLNKKVALFFLEQQPEETAKRICGKRAGKRFHIPARYAGWSQEELEATLSEMERDPRLFMYDHFGCAEWDKIADRIRFLRHSEDVEIFYLDHLTALATGTGGNEREELERIMAQVGSLVKELNIILVFISHLTTPEGTPHEEGGRVTIRQFKGSRAIGFWSHFMIGLERDQQHEDPNMRSITTVRMLKDRYTGLSTGECWLLGYDNDTGRLFETTMPTESSPFAPETESIGF